MLSWAKWLSPQLPILQALVRRIFSMNCMVLKKHLNEARLLLYSHLPQTSPVWLKKCSSNTWGYLWEQDITCNRAGHRLVWTLTGSNSWAFRLWALPSHHAHQTPPSLPPVQTWDSGLPRSIVTILGAANIAPKWCKCTPEAVCHFLVMWVHCHQLQMLLEVTCLCYFQAMLLPLKKLPEPVQFWLRLLWWFNSGAIWLTNQTPNSNFFSLCLSLVSRNEQLVINSSEPEYILFFITAIIAEIIWNMY